MLVDAGFVREGIGADYGLVRRTAEADELGKRFTRGVEFLHLNVVGVGKLVAADHEGGSDLFEGSVACTLADAGDGALDLTRSCVNSGKGVGDGHAEVIMAVRGEDD